MKRLLILLLSLAATSAFACTNLLVGKNASADGSAFITYSADSYGMFGRLRHYPAARHQAGDMRQIVDGDTNHYLGQIPEAEQTWNVVGNINEWQVSICETTFGGREELAGRGTIDYVSLMALGLQRAKTAREAIEVMTSLVEQYGYASEGESFSIGDPNEIWILEMIGRGEDDVRPVWVAVRIPDDCISAHANQSRIGKFALKDKESALYHKDVIRYAREKGFFTGKDEDFNFQAAYAPADFSSQRICEARVWSLFNRFASGMEQYLDFVDGLHIQDNPTPMPLYIRPERKISLADAMNAMRDHFEGTPFSVATDDLAAGPWQMPYRPTPLTYEVDGEKFFNERPIATQQASYVVVCQMRSALPREVGGVLWFANDEATCSPFTPVYCCATEVPRCYNPPAEVASDVKFSYKSAFWVQNWVANMTYPYFSKIFPDVLAERCRIEDGLLQKQSQTEATALSLLASNRTAAVRVLTEYGLQEARQMLHDWLRLAEHIIVKHLDMTVKKETAPGVYEMTPDGLAAPPQRPGYPDTYRRAIRSEQYRMKE